MPYLHRCILLSTVPYLGTEQLCGAVTAWCPHAAIHGAVLSTGSEGPYVRCWTAKCSVAGILGWV